MRLAIFSVMDWAVDLILSVTAARGDEIAVIVTCPGPPSRRSDAYLGVVAKAPPDVDVLVCNKKSTYAAKVAPYAPDALVCMGYPWLLPADLIALPPLGAFNVHNSLLPNYRGPNAFGWAIINGETELGITSHRMDAEFDTGPILQQFTLPFGINDTLATLSPQMGPAMYRLLNATLDQMAAGDPGRPQIGEGSYAPKFEPEFRYMDFSQPALVLHNKVRAYIGGRDLPKGALATLDGAQMCITETFYDPDLAAAFDPAAPGTVLLHDETRMVVQCGDMPLEMRAWERTDP
jgi:methionyl-tRNA formyltransferase